MSLNLEDQPGYLLNRTAMLFRRELMRALRRHKGMTPEQWQTLNTLWAAGTGLSPTGIAAVTLQDLPAISRMVKRMELNGWVERVADPADRRSFRVQLTAAGKRLEKTVPGELQGHFATYLGVLAAPEQKRLMELLRKLRQSFEDSTAG